MGLLVGVLIIMAAAATVTEIPRRYYVYALLLSSFCFVMGNEVSHKILTHSLKMSEI